VSKQYLATVVDVLENGDAVLQFPPELIEELGWTDGTVVDIEIDESGRITIKRVNE
jgi:antitoxin component of MazEF toxin-antitoxin module